MARHAAAFRNSPPVVVGTGLVALDVVFNTEIQGRLKCYAGGTCGNVLAILGFLDWTPRPVARLSPDPAAERILADLRQWNVATDLISTEAGGSTPIIIQRIGRR